MKVGTDIIPSITASLVLYSDVIVFICNFIMCLMLHSPIMLNIMAVDKISHGELFLIALKGSLR
jgi:hypothetical protein